ncbi:MAG: type IV pilus biogenesis/stability protein PilW [Povalibacter sp.]
MNRIVMAATLLLCAACTPTQPLSKPQPEKASDINLEIGTDYFRKGNLQGAKDKIDRAIEQNPRNAKAHATAGLLYDRLNDTKASEAHFERALSLDPNNPEFQNNYAVILCKRDKQSKGEKLFVQAANNPLYKTPEVAYLNAGSCARSAGNLEHAEANLRKALSLKPRFTEALYQMAELEYQKKNYMSARGFLERYFEAGRPNSTILFLAWRIEKGLGNGTAAGNYAQRLKLEYPNATETRQLLESERNAG